MVWYERPRMESRLNRGRVAGALVFFCIATAAAWGVPPLPARLQIQARRVGVLEAPAPDAMHMPTDVAVDGRDRVWVLDGAQDRILQFDTEGQLQQTLASLAQETFDQPVGLTVDTRDRLWVADTGNHRLLVAGPDGAHVEVIPLATPDARLVNPTDLMVTPDGAATWIVDNDNHRVLVRDNATGELTARGRFGRGLSQFEWPFSIAATSTGDILITEAIGARIQRISAAGRWAGQISRWGVQAGHLYRPKGIVVDARDRVYVSDSTLRVVQVFEAAGPLVGVLCEPDGRPLRFEYPMGLALDRSGRLYVVELWAHRVAVIELPDGFAVTAGNPTATTRPAGGGP
jgi:DNA-binding beta-propeller fold protein YncE